MLFTFCSKNTLTVYARSIKVITFTFEAFWFLVFNQQYFTFMKKTTSLRKLSMLMLFFSSFNLHLFSQDKLALILQEEVNREFSILKQQEIPAYYIAYRVDEVKNFYVSAQFGTLINSSQNDSRTLTITLRVGNPQLDNFHKLRDKADYSAFSRIQLPSENTPEAIKSLIWKATNDAYQEAVSKLSRVRTNVAVKVDEEDKAADFTLSAPVVFDEAPLKGDYLKFDQADWEKRIKKYSTVFLKDEAIFFGSATVSYEILRKYFVSSQGDNVVQNTSGVSLFVQGITKASDGMELPLYNSYFAYRPDKLPADAEIMKQSEQMVANLTALKNAPVADPFSGPALLSGEASGVFFHEIFGHRIEGQRMKSEDDAQTFKKKVNEVILPTTLSIYCDPLQKSYNNTDLNGYYKFDDEGSKAEKVTVVEQGVLKNFLMSRSPISGFASSNGHGRSQAGMQAVSRQSNLVIETSAPKTAKELRDELIQLAKSQNSAYGYLFQQVTGGFTMTGRFIPSSFNVTPTLVYRVYVDGRPDELVRGVDLIGTPLSMFAQIDMAGGEKGVFNGMCGAESGSVPVSCCSPTFLIKKIETQKKAKSQDRPYILERPTSAK